MTYDLNNTNWKNIKNRVKKYLLIMQLVKTVNVQTNKKFQKIFNGFYKIRQRSKEFYVALYDYLEYNKNKKISFKQTLKFFLKKFNRFEPSFSSKIVATISPNFPVWDSEVLAKLQLTAPASNLNGEIRFKQMIKVYNDIINWYSEFLNTEQAKNMIKIFDEKIGTLNIANIKKIDLIFWQTRS